MYFSKKGTILNKKQCKKGTKYCNNYNFMITLYEFINNLVHGTEVILQCSL